MTLDLERTLAQARDIAQQAGVILRQHAGNTHQIDYKGVVDLVTEADRASEAFITEALKRAFPTHHIYGEEGGDTGAPSAQATYSWLIDPLDGTTNFAHGLPYFAVSIALVDAAGEPLVGVVYAPVSDECFTAAKGYGAYLNGAAIHVSGTPKLARALVCTGFPYDRWTATKNNLAEWRRFIKRTQGVRRIGAAALDLAWVAVGRLDLYWEQRLGRWDILAGALLVQEAGGMVSDFDGGRAGMLAAEQIIASNGLVHDEALAVFRLGDAAPLPV